MSRSLNKVTLIGNLGADPEIRTTSTGSKVASFSLATSRQWSAASGEKQEKTEWHKCIAWNPKGERGMRLADLVEKYAKKGAENKKPSELSGGMKKRVGLARAIVYQPEIVLYDEPTTGLDPIMADSIDRLILRVRDRLNVTTVAVTHDMRSAKKIGHRIMMLHELKISSGVPAA